MTQEDKRRASTEMRAAAAYKVKLQSIAKDTDHLLAKVVPAEGALIAILALAVAPYAWSSATMPIPQAILMAIPIAIGVICYSQGAHHGGRRTSRQIIAACQMLLCCLLVV